MSRHLLFKRCIASLFIAGGLMFSACSKNTSQSDSTTTDKRPALPEAIMPGESGMTTAIGRAVDSARSIAATQLTAGQLGKLYAPQLKTLQTSLSQIQNNAAANPSLLSGDAGATYQELRTLTSELTETLNALRNYESDGPTDLAGKLQTGFAKAGELYTRLTGRTLTSPQS